MRTELEVKYDIIRGENYRLSKKLDYYESGKAFETLQRKHDEEIRSLNNPLRAAHSPSNQRIGWFKPPFFSS